MLKRVSFLDILKVPEFSHLNQFDLLPRSVDNDVAPLLWVLGLDIDRGIRVQASQHRTVDKKVVIGYSYVGLERNDKEWLSNRNCSMSARIHSQEDPYLASDMVRMSMEGTSESKFIEMCAMASGMDGTVRTIKKTEVEDWQENVAMMRTLRDIQKDIRGFLHADENMFDDEVEADTCNFETQTKSNY